MGHNTFHICISFKSKYIKILVFIAIHDNTYFYIYIFLISINVFIFLTQKSIQKRQMSNPVAAREILNKQ